MLLTILHVNALEIGKQRFTCVGYQSWTTYLLSITGGVAIVAHVEFDVLKTCTLRHLPMNPADIRFRVGEAQVYLEVLDVAQEIVLVYIPLNVSFRSYEGWDTAYHCWLSAM